jgi:hypothetical protein
MKCAEVPLYTIEDGEVTTDETSITPRLLVEATELNGEATRMVFAMFPGALKWGLPLNGILDRNYEGYKSILSQFKKITVNVALTAYDLATLDLTRRVYIDVYGCYFAIYKVTGNGVAPCEVELIKLP